MKNMKKLLALALVIVSVLAIAAPALAAGIEDYLGTSLLYYDEDKPMMMGQKVRNLQYMLTYIGFNVGGIDGKFGVNTDAAVRNLQSTYGLTVDGKVGPDTRAIIYMALGYQIPSECKKVR